MSSSALAPMWTPPISESAELTEWALYINHYSESNSLTRRTCEIYWTARYDVHLCLAIIYNWKYVFPDEKQNFYSIFLLVQVAHAIQLTYCTVHCTTFSCLFDEGIWLWMGWGHGERIFVEGKTGADPIISISACVAKVKSSVHRDRLIWKWYPSAWL
jgi:hypothetical protein